METERDGWGEQLLALVLNVLDGLAVRLSSCPLWHTCIPCDVSRYSSRGVR